MTRCIRWTPEDDQVLKSGYLKMNDYELGQVLDRTHAAVRGRRLHLGLAREMPVKKPWRPEEIDYLINNRPCLSTAKLADHLGRTYSSVKAKLYELRQLDSKVVDMSHGYWEDWETAHLKNNCATKTVPELANSLSRTERAITAKLRRLGLRAKPTAEKVQQAWEAYEIQFLKETPGEYSVPELMEKLDRSEESIKCMLKKLKIKPKRREKAA